MLDKFLGKDARVSMYGKNEQITRDKTVSKRRGFGDILSKGALAGLTISATITF